MSLLVPVDFSDVTDRIVEVAARLAVGLSSRVRLLHVADPDLDGFFGYEAGPQVVRDQVAAELREEHRALHRLADWLIREHNVETEALFVQGQTIETILEQADRIDAAFIVLGAHKRGTLSRVLLGSVSEGVMHQSTRPVVVVPAREEAG